MAETESLSRRIDCEFAAAEKKVKDQQIEVLREYREHRNRLQRLDRVFQKLAEAWEPRLNTLLQKFAGRVRVTPRLTPSSREATFEFESRRYRVRLRFSATTDRDVSKVILGYDLEIIPATFGCEPHAELEFPLEAVDEEAAGRWVDDWIIDFVRVYLSMGEDESDARHLMVEDPVARGRFPDFDAGATLEWRGQKYHFIGEETRQEFARQNGIALE